MPEPPREPGKHPPPDAAVQALRAVFDAIEKRQREIEGMVYALSDLAGFRAFSLANIAELADPAEFDTVRRWEDTMAQAQIAFLASRIQDRRRAATPDQRTGYELILRQFREAARVKPR